MLLSHYVHVCGGCEHSVLVFFFFQAEDGIRDLTVTGVQTCALPISVESQTLFIGTMVVDGIPIVAFKGIPPWSRTVMMPSPHNVVEAQRSHVVDYCFM